MSLAGNVNHNFPQEKIPAPLKPKGVERDPSEQNQPVQQQSATGLEWSAQAAAGQQMVSQQALTDNNVSQGLVKGKSRQHQLKAPGAEDIAMLSTSTAVKQESVTAVVHRSITNFLRQGFNMAALEEAYRETFRKSKSHNLLLERFMSHVKFSVLNGLFSLLGVSAEEQEGIQKEVREQALAEIDSRLKNEWAHSRAMLEIVG